MNFAVRAQVECAGVMFDELCNIADDELFGRAVRLSMSSTHSYLLKSILCIADRYNLRHRAHSLQLPSDTSRLSDSNFITRMLYKDKAHNS